MESVEFHQAAALLAWQLELGADEAICDAPVDRYALPTALAKPGGVEKTKKTAVGPYVEPEVDGVAIASAAAAGAGDLEGLQAAIAGFEHCELKRGARNLVFGEGEAGARIMVIGDAPDRDEDREGRPFVGRVGQLLNKMFGAIDMGRSVDGAPVYLTPVLPWRPPQGRDPKPDEIAMMKPFLERQIALVNPDVLILMGNTSCQMLLGKRGITRLRGEWQQVLGKPALPMFHPSYLMRTPIAKREAWADLLSVKARLNSA